MARLMLTGWQPASETAIAHLQHDMDDAVRVLCSPLSELACWRAASPAASRSVSTGATEATDRPRGGCPYSPTGPTETR